MDHPVIYFEIFFSLNEILQVVTFDSPTFNSCLNTLLRSHNIKDVESLMYYLIQVMDQLQPDMILSYLNLRRIWNAIKCSLGDKI